MFRCGHTRTQEDRRMYTSVLLFALTGFSPQANLEETVWQSDYGSARRQGESEKKPLAVVFAPGKEGWRKLSREGAFGKEIGQVLAASYVCLAVDTNTEQGRQLASAFDVRNRIGIVISDRTGGLMAFHHEGDLANRDLARYLNRFANPDRPVRTTETNPSSFAREAAAQAAPMRMTRNC